MAYYKFIVAGFGDSDKEAWANCYEALDESIPEVLTIEED